jgi:hypothetical protein
MWTKFIGLRIEIGVGSFGLEMAMNLQVPKVAIFLTNWVNVMFSSRTSVYGVS